MEERRLKSILSHLSPPPPPLSGKSDVLKGKSKTGVAEEKRNSLTAVSDDLQWPTGRHAEKLKAHSRYISESRSSSDMYESRHLALVKETTMRGTMTHSIASSSSEEVVDLQFKQAAETKPTDFSPASLQQVTGSPLLRELLGQCYSHCSELTIQRCGGAVRSRILAFEVGEEERLCGSSHDEVYGSLKGDITGYNSNMTGLTAYKLYSDQLHHSDGAQSHHSCTLSDAAHSNLDTECKLLDHHEALNYECQADQAEQRAYISDTSKAIETQRLIVLPGGLQDNQHEPVVSDQQAHAMTQGIFQSLVERSLQTSRGLHRRDSQAVDIGSEVPGSMTVSRNNVMTGQRRLTLEDCIFCLIVQGQSPAFKLYEDDLCVCILDVHPLIHGHSLIIPKAHFPSLEFTPPEVAAAMCATVPFISMAIMEATSSDSFNLLVNSGKAAGQVVFHTHFHIIPRRLGDNLWRSEGAGRRTLPVDHETSLLVQQIRHKLSDKRS